MTAQEIAETPCTCGCHAFDLAPHRLTCKACGHEPPDTDQTMELLLNGYTLDWACEAVAESHGQPRTGAYFRRLRSATAQRLEHEEL